VLCAGAIPAATLARSPMKLASLMLVAVLALGDGPAKDCVVLTAGSKVEGRVVYQDPKLVVVRVGTKDREIAMKDVAKITSRAAMHREAMEHWLKLDSKKTALPHSQRSVHHDGVCIVVRSRYEKITHVSVHSAGCE